MINYFFCFVNTNRRKNKEKTKKKFKTQKNKRCQNVPKVNMHKNIETSENILYIFLQFR